MPNHLLDLQSMNLISKSDITKQSVADLSRELIDTWDDPQLFAEIRQIASQFWSFIRTKCAYGILSHRWLPKDELTFQDMQSSFHPPSQTIQLPSQSPPDSASTLVNQLLSKLTQQGNLKGATMEQHLGLAKVINFCDVASKYDCRYVWFDTGCIDKSSSAELEESIRSMFSWYRNSKICIVHLARTTDAANIYKDPWFKRGWTLQELLAPPTIKFYDRFWKSLTDAHNDKVEDEQLGVPLWEMIGEITSIPQADLLSFKPGIQDVRQRLTWASKRTTTRIEDMAYCLIGIFDVPLPVAYGEGTMSFYRLQMEIMQRTSDKALFAWDGSCSPHNSMFAASPLCFSIPLMLVGTRSDTEYTLTNRGLRISLPFFEATFEEHTAPNDYIMKSPNFEKLEIVTLLVKPSSAPMRLALLGDIEPRKSYAILLDYNETMKAYRRATSGPVMKRPPECLKFEQMFII